jgi:hypothetical protein
MRFTHSVSIAALALSAAVAASAAPEQAVTRDAAQAMVGEIVHPVNGQIARYTDGICPSVIGVNEAFSHRVAERIRTVAQAAGAPVAPEGCAANLMVFFTNDPATFFQSVERDHPSWLRSLSRYSRKQMGTSDDPIIAWQAISTRDADDQPVRIDETAAVPVARIRVRETSFAHPVTRQTIDNSFVVVSLTAVNGRPIYQIADNIALRALTPLDVPKSAGLTTVLTAFEQEPTQAPAMLTAADAAFLRALYAGDGRQTAIVERQRVATAMDGHRTG